VPLAVDNCFAWIPIKIQSHRWLSTPSIRGQLNLSHSYCGAHSLPTLNVTCWGNLEELAGDLGQFAALKRCLGLIIALRARARKHFAKNGGSSIPGMDRAISGLQSATGPFPESVRTSSLASPATDSSGQKVPGTFGCAGVLYQNNRPARNEKERPNRVSLFEVVGCPTARVSRAARPPLTQPPSPKSTTASATRLAAAGGVGFTRC